MLTNINNSPSRSSLSPKITLKVTIITYIKYIAQCIKYIAQCIKYIAQCIKYITQCIKYITQCINPRGHIDVPNPPILIQAVTLITLTVQTHNSITLTSISKVT